MQRFPAHVAHSHAYDARRLQEATDRPAVALTVAPSQPLNFTDGAFDAGDQGKPRMGFEYGGKADDEGEGWWQFDVDGDGSMVNRLGVRMNRWSITVVAVMKVARWGKSPLVAMGVD
ncbi:hypothetical protein V6N11_078967 [Hibiscus sabdariffa]|uniref:Uncharacterized protein n=1 Tax=Hibiscus sabdariffa TaxID=183260 RepID=A0ABR2RU83_9ROSI